MLTAGVPGRREGGCYVHRNLAGFAHARGHKFASATMNMLDYDVDGVFVGLGDRYGGDRFAFGTQYVMH